QIICPATGSGRSRPLVLVQHHAQVFAALQSSWDDIRVTPPDMKIVDIRATTVTVPLEAPLRHANGCHWGRFVRTMIEVETDNGLIGLGEMGGGGESADAVFR